MLQRCLGSAHPFPEPCHAPAPNLPSHPRHAFPGPDECACRHRHGDLCGPRGRACRRLPAVQRQRQDLVLPQYLRCAGHASGKLGLGPGLRRQERLYRRTGRPGGEHQSGRGQQPHALRLLAVRQQRPPAGRILADQRGQRRRCRRAGFGRHRRWLRQGRRQRRCRQQRRRPHRFGGSPGHGRVGRYRQWHQWHHVDLAGR